MPRWYGLRFALSFVWLALVAITGAAMNHSASAGWANGVRIPRVDTYSIFGKAIPTWLGELLFDPRLILVVSCASLAAVLYSADRW